VDFAVMASTLAEQIDAGAEEIEAGR